jgi:hypothetical protein
VAGLALAAACTDRSNPAGPGGGPGGPGGPGTPGTPVDVTTLVCTGNTQTKTVSCDPQSPATNARAEVVIDGPNHKYVDVVSSNVNYNSATQAFTFDVKVTNRMPQPLGTADTTGALAPDTGGIKVYFEKQPVVNSGTGTVTVAGDGVGTFTASGQPFYKYSTVLEQYETSAPRTWQLNMPLSVVTFSFTVKIWASVPYTAGYLEVLGNFNVRSGYVRQLAFIPHTYLGDVDTTALSGHPTVVWTTSDTTRAVVDSTGILHGLRAGTSFVVVTTTSGQNRHSKVPANVMPVRRIWTGAAGVTNYENPANWLPVNTEPSAWRPDRVKPEPTDTVVVPDTTALFPVLNQNEAIGGVEVLDLTPGGTVPTLSLQAFNYTASGDVLTTNSASITNTSGSLVLTGTARTVAGTLPFLRVTGTYSLIGNVTARAPLRVDGGRLTNTGFRIQVTSF